MQGLPTVKSFCCALTIGHFWVIGMVFAFIFHFLFANKKYYSIFRMPVPKLLLSHKEDDKIF